MIKILYIGNDLLKNTKYTTTMDTLSNLLEQEKYTIYKSSSKTNKFLRLLDMCRAIVKHRDTVQYVLIDTYSTVNFYYAYITAQLCRLFRLKYVPILHGGNLPERINRSKTLSRDLFCNAYKNVSPSNYLKVAFEKKGYQTELIPNVLEIENYSFKQRDTIAPKLLYVRSFADIYNPTMAVKVLYELKKSHSEAELCMVGPDKDGTLLKVKEMITDLKLEDSVTITGVLSREKWHKLSENYDIFINTTNFDNTPVSVLEAMALGLPIVSTNAGGIPYLIDNEKDGVLVTKDAASEMTEAILSLMSSNKKAQEISKNARTKVEQYGWDSVKHKWFDILE